MKACRIHATGVVQGVGFRPWVWREAHRLNLAGWVRNNSAGVDILLEGPGEDIEQLLAVFDSNAPPLARIDALSVNSCEPTGTDRFEILASESEPGAYLPVSPDMATCDDCLVEMWTPTDRRYGYPFINCTNCGPRFTIVRDIPYDRPSTTMAPFEMCPSCRAEYDNPDDRRFHAQPIACPECGPRLRLECEGRINARDDEALRQTRELLADGRIVAIKGLGGFHLACDASNAAAVDRLRERKRREGKPFALMAATIDMVARHAAVSEAHAALLLSHQRPVVLLPRRTDSAVATQIAPGRDSLGFMLPYTPLHHLLLETASGFPTALVMTSANLSDEPIAYRDREACSRLATIADAFLLNDRKIYMRTDDSVVAEYRRRVYFFRRARGYAPLPVKLPFTGRSVLATGGELKNVFCVTRDDRAFLSHHIGDLEHFEAFRSFKEGLAHFERLFRIRPELIAHDLHPDYRATRAALERASREGLDTVAVQHHHAHIASCMADNGLGADSRVIGVSFDGTGYGTDGAIWGGEFLVADYTDYERASHLRYIPLPGGDAATRKPYRTALSWLRCVEIEWSDDLPPVREAGPEELGILERQLTLGINAPPTSSIGRLFDAVASLIGQCHRVSYEAQAAAELETLARSARETETEYPFGRIVDEIDPAPALRAATRDLREGTPPSAIAHRFHRGLARMVQQECSRISVRTGLSQVALSGGVWQNMLLLDLTVTLLEAAGLKVLIHHQVPANDGGLALGQAAVALARSMRLNESAP